MQRLTYSNVVSTLCLFLLVAGGTAVAAGGLGKESVGTEQLKKSAVTGVKIRKGAVSTRQLGHDAVTGSKIATWTLGPVPSATHALSADTATSAGHAATADSATWATAATRAATAEALAAPEAPREIGASGQPQFEDGATYYYEPVTFYRDRQCRVYAEGPLWAKEGAVAFTLPPGYRPPVYSIFRVAGESTATDAEIEIAPDGTVEPYSSSTGFQSFYLDGISFRVPGC